MTTKSLVWFGLFVGSTVGGYLPTLFGVSAFSLWSVFWSAVGGLVGIYLGYKLGEEWML